MTLQKGEKNRGQKILKIFFEAWEEKNPILN